MAKQVQDYTEDTIVSFKDLEQVIARPTAFLSDRGVAGQIHMLREIIDNSVDELVLKPDGGTIYVCLFRDRVHQRYQVAILDEGRGIPSSRLTAAVTSLGTSGKSSQITAYTASGGLFGYGLKVSAALSTKFKAVSANYLEEVVSGIYLENGKVIRQETVPTTEKNPGTLVIVEPDLKYFGDDASLMECGYLDLIAICRQLNIFNPQINFQFYLYERRIPDELWKANPLETFHLFSDVLKKKKTVEYSSLDYPDKAAYLFDIWKVDKKPIFEDTWFKLPANQQDKLGFDIKMFFMKKSATGRPKFFVSINNISIPDVTGNSATIAFMSMLKTQISIRQTDPKFKEFVLQEYIFPTLMLAMGINYHGAELSGATKTSFKDQIFGKQFMEDLMVIARSKGDAYWQSITDLLQPDIELRYNQIYETPTKKTDDKKVFMGLNFTKNFSECKILDPERSELYIVEGTSAGNIIGTRDKNYQAVYTTRGKPPNCATKIEQLSENRKRLLKDPIYQDLMTILGVNPDFKTTPRLRYNRIIIATDADPDGSHIRVLHLNNFYIINPLFVSSGFMWLANPPLYSMDTSKTNRFYLRDKTALMDARIQYIYEKSLDIKVDSVEKGIQKLSKKAYWDLCYLIHYLGNHFEVVAKQLNIPLMILERLVLGIHAIFPKVNYLKLEEYLVSNDAPGFIRVNINEPGRYIVISVGEEDFPIGLDAIGKLIRDHLYPLVLKFGYKDYWFIVSSKFRGATIYDQPLSMMGLYILMKQLDGYFKVRRYKGLGEMMPDDCYDTLMNPETRSLTHVIDIGDINTNYNLLGTDSYERKVLMSETGMLSQDMLQPEDE